MQPSFLAIILSLIAGIFFHSKSFSQEYTGIGGSAIYNLQSEGVGFGARVHIPVKKRIVLVPQIQYYPPFNIVNEYLLGINMNYNLIIRRSFIGYLTGGGYFNLWSNAATSPYKKAKPTNILPDIGGGILIGRGCVKPFVEQRYNPLWREGTFHIGFLWFPGCSSGSGYNCPAYM